MLLPITSTYSSASSTVIAAHSPGMGRLSPSLIKSLPTTDDWTPKSAATHAVSIRTDSGFSNLAFSSLLCNFSTGTSRELRAILARQLQQPEWRTHSEMSPRLLQPQHSPLYWLTKFSSCSNWSTWLSDYQVIKLCIYILYLLPLYNLILMNLSASKNISMTFQGYVEEWNSKFPHFKSSLPCLV